MYTLHTTRNAWQPLLRLALGYIHYAIRLVRVRLRVIIVWYSNMVAYFLPQVNSKHTRYYDDAFDYYYYYASFRPLSDDSHAYSIAYYDVRFAFTAVPDCVARSSYLGSRFKTSVPYIIPTCDFIGDRFPESNGPCDITRHYVSTKTLSRCVC